jgi:hypothetical protein
MPKQFDKFCALERLQDVVDVLSRHQDDLAMSPGTSLERVDQLSILVKAINVSNDLSGAGNTQQGQVPVIARSTQFHNTLA